MKLHPEVREKFHELVRFHFSPFRRGKDVHEIRKAMRERDAKDQAALLKGNCEFEIMVTHQRSCDSLSGSVFYSYPCDCTPTKEIKFTDIAAKKIRNAVFQYYGFPPSDPGSDNIDTWGPK